MVETGIVSSDVEEIGENQPGPSKRSRTGNAGEGKKKQLQFYLIIKENVG